MKKWLVVCATFVLALSTAKAAEWKMSVENPDGNYHTENAKQFSKDIADATKGALQIKVFSNAELLKRPELKRGVRQGIVEVGDITLAVLGNDDPLFEIDSVPLLATNFDEAQKLWSVSRPAIEKRLAADGLMVLYAVPWPPQGVYSSDPIVGAESLKGVRFRAYNAMTSRLAVLLGASPVTIAPGEIPQGFSTGVIKAMITSPATGVDYQAWDFVKHYYDVAAFIPKQVALMNKAAFDKMSPDIQAAVVAAGKAAEERGWKIAREKTNQFTKTLASKGMRVEPTPVKLKAEFKEVGATILNEWLAKAGAGGTAIVEAYRK